MPTLAPFKYEVWAPSRRYLNILRGQTITITVNGGLPENSLTQSNDSNGKFEQRSGALLNMGVATGLFIWRMCPRSSPSPRPPPLPLSVRLHMGRAGRGSSHSIPSPRGVCCSILMTKTGEGVRSRYHTLICLRRGSPTIQSAGVRRNSVKAGGGSGRANDKRQE